MAVVDFLFGISVCEEEKLEVIRAGVLEGNSADWILAAVARNAVTREPLLYCRNWSRVMAVDNISRISSTVTVSSNL